jgi:hypothetical protein
MAVMIFLRWEGHDFESCRVSPALKKDNDFRTVPSSLFCKATLVVLNRQFLKGHDFSRAVQGRYLMSGFSP